MGCDKCQTIAAELRRLGPEGCRRDAERMIAKIIANRESQGHKVGPIEREGIRTLYFVAVRRAERKQAEAGKPSLTSRAEAFIDNGIVKAAVMTHRMRSR